MAKWIKIVLCGAVAAAVSVSWVGASAQDHRDKIDAGEATAMDLLLELRPEAKSELDEAYGHAVMEISVEWGDANYVDKQGDGVGVAVEKSTKGRTYMECSAAPDQKITQSYIVFLFEDEAAFKSFTSGWKPGNSQKKAEANAGLKADSGFVNGIKVYQMDNGQLLAVAPIWDTVYNPSKHLNK
jgi:hypothetical protein